MNSIKFLSRVVFLLVMVSFVAAASVYPATQDTLRVPVGAWKESVARSREVETMKTLLNRFSLGRFSERDDIVGVFIKVQKGEMTQEEAERILKAERISIDKNINDLFDALHVTPRATTAPGDMDGTDYTTTSYSVGNKLATRKIQTETSNILVMLSDLISGNEKDFLSALKSPDMLPQGFAVMVVFRDAGQRDSVARAFKNKTGQSLEDWVHIKVADEGDLSGESYDKVVKMVNDSSVKRPGDDSPSIALEQKVQKKYGALTAKLSQGIKPDSGKTRSLASNAGFGFTGDFLRRVRSEMSITGLDMRSLASRYRADMEKGLKGQKSSLQMIPAHVAPPTGLEKGKYYFLDIGGSNLRVGGVNLLGNGQYDLIGASEGASLDRYRAETVEAFQLFSFIADKIADYLDKNGVGREEAAVFGLTWSFPVEQTGVDSGVHKFWTKGWQTKGVVGHDPVKLLREAISRNSRLKGRDVVIQAICNDTVGTFATGRYVNFDCGEGVILGTGTNASYPEDMGNITKWKGKVSASQMCINQEWGAFKRIPLTEWDKLLDAKSVNPGKQILEKTFSGMYLGEITRLILQDMISKGMLFSGRSSKAFDERWDEEKNPSGFQASYMSRILADISDDLKDVNVLLGELGILDSSIEERRLLKDVSMAVAERGARIAATVMLATVIKNDPELKNQHSIAIDGSLFEKFPFFKACMEEAVKELAGDDASNIKMFLVKDGSGVGAAILAAVAHNAARNSASLRGVAGENSRLASGHNLGLNRELKVKEIFEQKFGYSPAIMTRGPGRPNIIGEHVDYPEFKVYVNPEDSADVKIPHNYSLPFAAQQNVLVAAKPRSDNKVIAHFVNYGSSVEIDLDKIDLGTLDLTLKGKDRFQGNQSPANYLLGAYKAAKEKRLKLGGAEFVIEGDIPLEAGMSSSAGLCVGVGFAFSEMFGWDMYDSKAGKVLLALFARDAEHKTGSNCGYLDQLASVFGEEGKAVKIDYGYIAVITDKLARGMPVSDSDVDALVETVSLQPVLDQGYKFLLINSKVPRALVTTEYNTRVKELEEAGMILSKALGTPWAPHVSCYTLDELHSAGQSFIALGQRGAMLYKRVYHVLAEKDRVIRAYKALEGVDVRGFAAAINDSGKSLSMDGFFEISASVDPGTKAVKDNTLDVLVQVLLGKGAIAARMMGGGGGGCAIALVKEDIDDMDWRLGIISDTKTISMNHNSVEFVGDRVLPSEGAGLVDLGVYSELKGKLSGGLGADTTL